MVPAASAEDGEGRGSPNGGREKLGESCGCDLSGAVVVAISIGVLVAGIGEAAGEGGESSGGEPSVAGDGSVEERGEGEFGAT